MNTHPEYRRHAYRPPETANSPAARDGISQLARHADPSLTQTQPTSAGAKRMAWVRPTELAGFTGPLIGRGVDLQTELVRRARRTPIVTARTVRNRVDRSLPQGGVSRKEGLGL
jgi:hypothetical protein